MGNSYKNKFRL